MSMTTTESNQPSSFQPSKQSNRLLVPALPFSIWDGDTLVWASDEQYARKLTPRARTLMANKTFVMNGKSYTVVCDALQGAHAEMMAKTIQAAVSGIKDRNTVPLLSFYHICKEFFENDLSTHFLFSQSNLTSSAFLECGVPFMFALLLTIYPILCKSPASDIDLHFESKKERSSITITPHCEFDLYHDILHGDFVSELLKATLQNADFSLIEKQNDQEKSLVLSSKHTTLPVISGAFKSVPDFELYSVFVFFASLCAREKESQ